jgi:hypothetical protein
MEMNNIEYRKPFYPVREPLQEHLTEYSLSADLPITYEDLLHYRDLIPVVDSDGNPTLWYSVLYDNTDLEHFRRELTAMYQLLAGSGNSNPFLKIASIEFCSFGNSKPFRIKVINVINDIYDFYYIKQPDASRVYGLELEEIFSPNKVSFLLGKGILLEQHIIGIPCDDFIKKNDGLEIENRGRFAKEFVKFNERCYARLLGDMRAYNFVVEIIQDFDNVQYRLRAIDFDQQCYEGRRSIYLPQFYKENIELVNLAQTILSKDVADQYVREERLAMRKRFLANITRTRSILKCMADDVLSTPENTDLLRTELAKYHDDEAFYQCDSMGKVLCLHLENLLGIKILNL